ncbi:MAG TPA: hypothetical protein PKE69_19405 [Pyrinomonadaceae bacterium]|nr:hypothetical protein [Pyrinomonadaceae bacterium]
MAYDLGSVLSLCQCDAQKAADKRKAEIAKPLRMHAYGDKLKSLIEKHYPTEPGDVHKYRMENLPHITGIFFNKVANVISGIPQSKDFVLNNWNKSGRYADFEQYCTREYPQTGNIVNWVFNYVSEEMLIEPNGIIVAGYEDWFSAPLAYFKQNKEYDVEQPIARLYRFEHIKAYKKNEYLVLKRDDKKSELVIIRNKIDYSVYLVFGAETVDITPSFPLEYLPAFILGGKPDNYESQEIYSSFVSCAMPPLDKVIQYTSEEDLMIKESIFAILVMVGGDPCGTCLGDGFMGDPNKNEKRSHCKTCSGRGYIIPKNSAAVRVISPPKKPGEQLPSGPGMWWVQPDISIIKPLTEAIEKQWYLAYSSINFEFIAETPAAQAGIAKAYYRQPLNSFFFKNAS